MSKAFRVLVADPPWPEPTSYLPSKDPRYRNEIKGKGLYIGNKNLQNSAAREYDLLSLEEICSFKLPKLADDCFLWLWVPHRKFEDALQVMKAWGFKYCKTGIVWVKMKNDLTGPTMRPGVRIRMVHELLLLGVKGKPKQKVKNLRSVFLIPPRKHSQKPEEIMDAIEQYSNGPYAELFARRERAGWSCFGNEI